MMLYQETIPASTTRFTVDGSFLFVQVGQKSPGAAVTEYP
jgi:hypothetical protein